MATLNGIVRFSGQVGDLIFYRRGKKDVVRRKSGTHQLSENSKKSAKDFGEASRNAAYIRKAFAPMVKAYGYGDLASRLTKRITSVFNTIPNSAAGNKKLFDGNLKLIEGFEFNADTRLDRLLLHQPKVSWAPDGLIELVFPKIELKHLVKTAPQSDAFVMQVMVFDWNVHDGAYEILKVNDLKVAFSQVHFPGAKLHVPVAQQGERILLVAIGICYLQEQFRKEDRRYFACQISHCYHIKDGVEVVFTEPIKEEAVPLEEAQSGLSWELGEG
ncbi:hypothetical protein [Pedobacter jejuensis]|uniref:Uncharacterized protein n=1 Tax=Pedobacter jejuensis TaxID=1268550 RepID=A0A3N0BWS4_9SPHI|nr:hypothetical protein [Pedobacter jejuensis]RNL54174.1 hypothetical protein D7004_08765 [Pedobacter jejuensis]